MIVVCGPAGVMKTDLNGIAFTTQMETDAASLPVRLRLGQLQLKLSVGLIARHLRPPIVTGAESETVFRARSGCAGAGFGPPGIQPGRRRDSAEDLCR